MTAIAVNKRDDLPDAIRSIIEAVKFSELDIQIEVVDIDGRRIDKLLVSREQTSIGEGGVP